MQHAGFAIHRRPASAPPPSPPLLPLSRRPSRPDDASKQTKSIQPASSSSRPSTSTPRILTEPFEARHRASPLPPTLSRQSSQRQTQGGPHLETLHLPATRRPSSTTVPRLSKESRAQHTEDPSYFTDTDEEFGGDTNQYFPPLPPTAGTRTAVSRSRKDITARIRDGVARYAQQDTIPSVLSDTSVPVSERYSSDDEIQRLWVLLKEKRQGLEMSRVSMAGQRKILRELRRRKDEADNAFMGLLRPMLANGQSGGLSASKKILEARFNDMQKLRTEYHSLEIAYEGFEVALDEQEEEINRLEIRFFRTLAMTGTPSNYPKPQKLQKTDEHKDSPSVPYTLLGISSDRSFDEVHPLWNDLLDAIGDMNIAQEELNDVYLNREELEWELGVKERTKLPVTADDFVALHDFPADEQAKRELLQEATTQVHKLREKCESLGLEPPWKVAYALGLDVGDEIVLDDSTSDTEKTLAHDRYPGLLSQPDHLLQPEPLTALSNLKQIIELPAKDASKIGRMRAAFKEYGISHLLRDTKETDKTDFINRWLLQCLRTSPLLAELLAITFTESTHLQIVDSQRWELDVLIQWWKDDAAVRSVEVTAQLAFTLNTTGSSQGPQRRPRIRTFSRSSQIKALASEPPDYVSAKYDIWESREPMSRQLGSEAASGVLILRFWDEEYGGKPG